MNTRLLWAATAASIAALFPLTPLVAASPAAAASDHETTAFVASTRAEIALLGSASFPLANGKSRYEVRGGERRFRVEVEDTGLANHTTLFVFVDGQAAGSMNLNHFGDGALALNSTRGDIVPAVNVPGSTVVVATSNGTVVVSGTF